MSKREPLGLPLQLPEQVRGPLAVQLLRGAFGRQGDAVVAFHYKVVSREVLESAAVDIRVLALADVVGHTAAVLVEHPEWLGGRLDYAWVERSEQDSACFAAVAALWEPGSPAADIVARRRAQEAGNG